MAKIVNKYPVGIQTFEKIRKNGYLYIDKTKYIVDFREKQMSYVFLSAKTESLLCNVEAYTLYFEENTTWCNRCNLRSKRRNLMMLYL